jgi:hypothetical protein
MQTLSTNRENYVSRINVHKNIKPDVDLKKVLRYLGARRGSAPARTVNMIKTFIKRSEELIEPKVLEYDMTVLSSENRKVFLSSGMEFKSLKLSRTMSACNKAKVFVATIGEKIEKKINELMAKDKYAEAAIMDAIASVAVEDTVETFHSNVDLKLKAKSKCTTLRFSPGYCDWDINEQQTLFNMVDASSIGVSLSKNNLMSPRKSISGIFGIGSCDDISCKTTNPCLLCEKKDCIARRTES